MNENDLYDAVVKLKQIVAELKKERDLLLQENAELREILSRRGS